MECIHSGIKVTPVRYNNLYLLPSAQSKDKDSVTPQQMIDLTSCLKEEFDYVLIDCPAGIEQGFRNAICKDKDCYTTTN